MVVTAALLSLVIVLQTAPSGCYVCLHGALNLVPTPACLQDRLQRELANTSAVREACRQLQVRPGKGAAALPACQCMQAMWDSALPWGRCLPLPS